MSLSPFHSRRLRFTSTVCAVALAGSALAVSPALASQAEQVSRADGVAGASPIESHNATPAVISDDGASVYFHFEQAWGTWATANGLWRRDVATNKTTQIVGGDALPMGLTADNKVLAIRSSKRLVAADKNTTPDLYSYDTVSRKIDLVSRWDGLTAAAVGLKGSGFITRDGKTALYGTSVGVARRDLATGKTVKVADGTLPSGPESASADGSVFFVSDDKLVTPRAVETISTPDTYATAATISPNGRYAVVTAVRSSDGTSVGFILDTTTGVRTAFDPGGLGQDVRFVGFSTDNRPLAIRSTGPSTFEVLALTLPGGAATRVATFEAPIWSVWTLTPNAKFVVATANGASFAVSADGVNLPGGADLPSPGAYLVVYPGCRTGFLPAQPSEFSRANPSALFALPKISRLLIRVTSASGAVLQTYTFTKEEEWDPQKLPVGGGFKLNATLEFTDGRSVSETWTVVSPKGICTLGL